MDNIKVKEDDELTNLIDLINCSVFPSNKEEEEKILFLWERYFPRELVIKRNTGEINFLKVKNIIINLLLQNLTDKYDVR